jgi:hypothetical protein
MKKAIIIILIILALIGAGAYYFLSGKKDSVTVCEPGFRLDFGTRTCVPIASGDKPIDVDFERVEITVPETSLKVKLMREGQSSKYSAAFADPDDPVMKGFVSIDSGKLTRVSDEYVLVPLFVTYGGTGQFLNLALFNAKSAMHVGSVFVGDRVEIHSIEPHNTGTKIEGNYIYKANYKTRLMNESFAVTPTVPAQLVVEIKGDTVSEIMRLQNADYGDIEIKSPTPNAGIAGDFVIKGSMPGSWYFEAVAQFKILDATYKEIAIGSVQALSDWMTTQRVPFEVKMNTSMLNTKGKATIVISSENVEGGDEGERNVKRMEIPVVIR